MEHALHTPLSGKIKDVYSAKADDAEASLLGQLDRLENYVGELSVSGDRQSVVWLRKFADEHSIPHDTETTRDELVERAKEYLAKMRAA